MIKELGILGAGVVSGLGLGCRAMGRALQEGHSGVGFLPDYQNRDKPLAVGLAPLEEVLSVLSSKGIEVGSEESRAFSLAAYVLGDALSAAPDVLPTTRTGFFLGSSLTTSELVSNAYEMYFVENRCAVKTIFECTSAMLAAKVAETQKLNHTCLNISNSCASSTMAMRAARNELRLSALDRAVVVGVDSCFTVPFLDTWCSSRVLSRLPDAADAARPFCATRRGFVFAEAAAALVLGPASPATPFAISGLGHSVSARPFHELNVDAMVSSMKNALDDAGLSADEIVFVHAAANGSLQGDLAEAEAIHQVFGAGTPVYSSKALTGNTFGASGAVGLVACLELCASGRLPRNPHLCEADERISGLINCMYQEIILEKSGYVLVNSFGFGGQYASLVLRYFV